MSRKLEWQRSGVLWDRVQRTSENALRCGALQPVATTQVSVYQAGIEFVVRLLTNIVRKERAQAEQERKLLNSSHNASPFLPYEPDLFVSDVSATHIALLNKFNVLNEHLLIVTRSFEDQECLLTLADFEAMWLCMAQYRVLAFYNGGTEAGASQAHKHLQMVPLTLAPTVSGLPLEPVLPAASVHEAELHRRLHPFFHVLAPVSTRRADSAESLARETLALYHRMLHAAGLQGYPTPEGIKQSAPYNLLVTREWMMLVPRAEESCEGISVNALGFVGALLVRDEAQLDRLRAIGPLSVLRAVTNAI